MTDTTTTTTQTPTAVLITADRYLAAHLGEIHPGVTAITPPADDPRLDRVPDSDGVLRLTGSDGTRTFYIGVDLDDPRIWSHAVDVSATHVVVLPDGIAWLRRELTTHLGAPTTDRT